MADDDLVVEIEKEAPAGTEKPDAVADLQSQYDELQTRERAANEAASAAAAREATERQARLVAEEEVKTTRTEVTESRLSTVESGLAAAQTEAEAAQAEYVSAQEAGDWKRAGEAQRKMSRAEARIVRLDEAKADLEAAKVAPAPVARRTEEPAAPLDPVESYIRGAPNNPRPQKTQDWLRAHRDYVTDDRKNKKLNAAHLDAEAEGVEVGSSAYFTHVEKFLGLRKDDGTHPSGNGAAKPERRSSSAPVAPVERSAGGTNGGGDVVHLTRGEATSATDGTLVWNHDDPSPQKKFKKGDPIGTQEMARRKLAMTKEGQYDPMNFMQS